MIEWRRIETEEAREIWDREILRFPEANLSQSFAWGEHKKSLGRPPVRLIGRSSGKITAMAQCFIRRYPLGFASVWIPGGPIGPLELFNDEFRQSIARAANARRLWIRVRPYRLNRPEDARILRDTGWKKADCALDTGLTIFVPLDRPESETLKTLSSNWAHNLRRAQARNRSMEPWKNPSARDIFDLLKEVERYKNMPRQYSHSLDEIQSFLSHFNGGLILWRSTDDRGKPIALRACVVFGARAYDLLAAASEEGRKLYSSYGLLWEILKESRRKGAAEFDMGGVDPEEAGVYNFKKGLGGQNVEHLGEWDWASSEWLRRAANFMIRHKIKQ